MNQKAVSGPDKQKSKIESIQVLRGIASLMVTIYHLKDIIGKDEAFKKELDFLFDSGPAGVSLFFIISGFIIVFITSGKPVSGKDIMPFMLKRVIRIWPAYVAITIAYFVMQMRIAPGSQHFSDLLLSIFFIPIATTDPPFYGYATLPVGWSLNYEIYFYLLTAISMSFAKYRWFCFFGIIGLTLIVIPVMSGHFTWQPAHAYNYGNGYLNMITNPVIWNFVFGVIIGLLFIQQFASTAFSHLFSSKWLTASFICLAIWQYLSGFSGGLGPFQWGLGALAAFSAFLFYNAGRPVVFPGWLVRVGDISFSLYLLHVPVVVFVSWFFKKIGYPIYGGGLAAFFLSLSLTLILSELSFRYLETGVSGWLRKKLVLR